MFSEFITAIRTLTIIPIPGSQSSGLYKSLPFFPVIGLVVGIFTASLAFLLSEFFLINYRLCAILVLFFSTLLTGGLHLDGLADSADGLLAHTTFENRLKILKDPRVGSYGAIGLILILYIKLIAFEILIQAGAYYFLIPVFIFSRTAQVEMATTLTYARKNQGTARDYVQGSKKIHRQIAWCSACFMLALFGLGIVVLSIISFFLLIPLRHYYYHKIRGITGDLIGATSEISEAFFLVMLAALYNNALNPVFSELFLPLWSML